MKNLLATLLAVIMFSTIAVAIVAVMIAFHTSVALFTLRFMGVAI